jgi:hypothetical protein
VALRVVSNMALHFVLLFRVKQSRRIALIAREQKQAAHI